MASTINASLPVEGTPTTQSVRDNFQAARDEITALQDGKADLAGPALTGSASAVNLSVSGTLNACLCLGRSTPRGPFRLAASPS